MKALQTIYQHPLITAAEMESICNAHKKVSFSKGEFILKKGEISKSYLCIEQGLIRAYVYDFNGNEISTGFIGKNEIAIDVVSLFHQIPTVEYLQALTDCECYRIDFEEFQVLYHGIKGFNEWGRSWMSESLFQLKQRTIAMITDSAADRYRSLRTQHPQILQQAPLKHIASYLGITDTSLSRIRNELSRES
ncbi:MAG: Crp/Fnr family transcriptional regulator [Pedobacter sp.]|nr:MAG: Crp/Fnr family transcriptional regulator [Pedobacter sp.]